MQDHRLGKVKWLVWGFFMRSDSVSIREKMPTNVAYFVRESVATAIDHCDIAKRRIAKNTAYVGIRIQINVASTALSWNERITVLHGEQNSTLA